MNLDKHHQMFFPLKNILFISSKHEISAVIHLNIYMYTNIQHRTDLQQTAGLLQTSATYAIHCEIYLE